MAVRFSSSGCREARRRGISLEEYVLELVLRDLDPPERAKEYVEASKDLLEQAREGLKKDDVRQAAEKAWGAAALAVRHSHRCWGARGLDEVEKHFDMAELDEDDSSYYVLAIKH